MRRQHLSVETGLFLRLCLTILQLATWLSTEKILRLQATVLLRFGKQPEHYQYSAGELKKLRTWIAEQLTNPTSSVGIEQPRNNYFQITLEEVEEKHHA